jgi:Tfp pilus assembly protein PilX
MKSKRQNDGSVFVITLFAIALLSALAMGMLQIDTGEIQVMRNQIFAAEALVTAEAGLNDAFSHLRGNSSWNSGFTSKAFNSGSYSVSVTGTLPNLIVESTGISPQNFVCRIEAEITIDSGSPHVVRIDNLRINE